MAVILSYPNNQRKEVLLAGVPRVGEHIRVTNGPEAPSLVVEQVLWMEDSKGNPPDPQVILVVREHVAGPKL